MTHRTTAVGVAALAIAAFAGAAATAGDCSPTWDRSFGLPGFAPNDGFTSVSTVGFWNGELYLGGSFDTFNGVAGTSGFARIDGQGVTRPLNGGIQDQFVNAFAAYDPGDGEKLYIGGVFNGVNNALGAPIPGSNDIVSWDGATLAAVPGNPFTGPFDSIFAVGVWDGKLVAGGTGGIGIGADQRPSLGIWDGNTWDFYDYEFNGLVAPVVLTIGTYNGDLIIGGRFDSFDPDQDGPLPPVVSKNIIGFDGANWFPLDTGLSRATSPVSQVLCMIEYDDGTGNKLYVGGRFDRGSGNVVPAVAAWDGETWQAVGTGFTQAGREVRDFAIYDDGTGEALYAIGNFEIAGATVARRFAKWTGGEWVEVGGGIGENPGKMVVGDFPDDDRGAMLFQGGSFTTVGHPGSTDAGPNAGTALGAAAWVGCEAAACEGDTNGDGAIDFSDLNAVLNGFGTTGEGLPGDVNGDGSVNFSDLNIVLNNFGTTC